VTRSGGLGVTVTSNPATLFGNVGGGTFFKIDRYIGSAELVGGSFDVSDGPSAELVCGSGMYS